MDTVMRQHHIKIGLFLLLTVLQIIDVATTVHMINAVGSVEIEANPIMKLLLISTGSLHSLWVAKLVIMLIVAACLTKVSNTTMVVVNAIMLVVVSNNLYIIFSMG